MEKRTFEDRESLTPNRRKITILQQHANEIIADIELDDNASKTGTPVNSELLKFFQDNIFSAVEDSSEAKSTSQNAQQKSENAETLANEAKTQASSALEKSNEALTKATNVETALADRGATVYIGGSSTPSVSFTSDPQSQINSKINSSDAVSLSGNQTITGSKTFQNITTTNKIINYGETQNAIQTKGIVGSDGVGNEDDLHINFDNGKRTIFNGNNEAETAIIDKGQISAKSANFKETLTALNGEFSNALKINGNPAECVVAKNLAQNGYIQYSSGLIIEWGFIEQTNTNEVNVSFDESINFNSPPVVYATWQNPTTRQTYAPVISEVKETGCKIFKDSGGAQAMRQFWLAIGY